MFKLVAGLNPVIKSADILRFLDREDLAAECDLLVVYFDSGSTHEKQITFQDFESIVLPSKSSIRKQLQPNLQFDTT